MRKAKKIERLEFHISYACHNNCIFCSEKERLEWFDGKFIKAEKIKKELAKRVGQGLKHITFTGGEATLHPDIIDLLRFSKGLNCQNFIGSNGGLFYMPAFCREALPHVDQICFSLHGHNAKLHNFHVRNNKSFDQLKKALKNVEQAPFDIFVMVNIVVTKYNFKNLDKIIGFAARYKKVKRVIVSAVAPGGNGLRNYKELAVSIAEMREKIPGLVDLADKKSLKIKFFGLPLCALGDHERRSSDVGWSPRATLKKDKEGKKVILRELFGFQPLRDRMLTKKCGSCLKREWCPGTFEKYFQEFGDSELQPFSSK